MFVSYAHKDGKDVAVRIEEGLRKMGLRVWRDETDLSVGDRISGKVGDALARSSHMVAVVSPTYLDRGPTMMELGGKMLGGGGGAVFPVLLGTSPADVAGKVPWLVDTFMRYWDDGAAEQVVGEIARAAASVAGNGDRGPEGQEPGGGPAIAAGGRDARRRMLDAMEGLSRGTLASIPSKIGGVEIPRPQAAEIASRLEWDDRIVLTGDRGSGKSVIMRQLYERLAADGRRAVLVRCDDLLRTGSPDGPDGLLGSGTSILRFVEGEQGGSETVFLFDSLDAVSRDAESMSAFRRFLRRLWGASGVRTVCSVRAYDYENSPDIVRDDWGMEVCVGDLEEEELEEALERMGGPAVPIGLRKILRNPLRLRLLHMIVEKNPNVDLSGVAGEVQLYGEHWRECVGKDEQPDRAECALLDIASKMVEARRTHVSAVRTEGIGALLSGGIVEESHGRLRFFHHAYLDYAAARHVLRDYPSVRDYLERDEYNVFFRPALAFALSMLRDGSRQEHLRAVASICMSGLKNYWKISALESLAASDGLSEEEVEPVGRMLTEDADLQAHFLAEAARARNPFWFHVWSGTVMEEWAARGRSPGRVAEYIRSLSGRAELHEEMVRIVRLIISSGRARREDLERIVATTSGMSAPGKAAWYAELSQGEDARLRAGVLHCLGDLLGEDPGAAADAFRNIATHDGRDRPAPHGSRGPPDSGERERQNAMLKANDMYEGLLSKSPVAMVRAAVESVEALRGGEGSQCEGRGRIAGDPDDLWTGWRAPSIHTTMLAAVAEALPRLLRDGNAPAYAAILASSRMAVFHGMLLRTLLGNPARFKGLIYGEVSDPDVLALPSLRWHVQAAIRSVSPLLSGRQRQELLGRIMDIGQGGGRAAEEDHCAELKSRYLSAFDPSSLSREHLDFLERFPAPAAVREEEEAGDEAWAEVDEWEAGDEPESEDECGASEEPDRGGTPHEASEGSLEDAVEALSRAVRDHRVEPAMIEEIVGFLASDGIPPDAAAAGRLRRLLLDLAAMQGPEEGAPGGLEADPGARTRTRMLAARGLVRLHIRSPDASLSATIEEIAADGSGRVRGGVARELEALFGADPALAGRIAARYSRDRDRRVLDHMKGALLEFVKVDESAALAAVENILSLADSDPDEAADAAWPLLVLALRMRSRQAFATLRGVLADTGPPEVREAAMHMLGGCLSEPDAQDGVLEAFSLLLDSGDHGTRAEAARCLALAIDDYTGDMAALLEKAEGHLDKMSGGAGGGDSGHRMLGALTGILKDQWQLMPERALGHLERVADRPESPYQPRIMRNAVEVLNGLFRMQHGEDGRRRCLSVLDRFVAAGWPSALDLLRKMERPD